MTTQLVLRFSDVDELLQVLQLLRSHGFDRLTVRPPAQNRRKKPETTPEKVEWAFGIGDLGGQLDHINIRDYAYED